MRRALFVLALVVTTAPSATLAALPAGTEFQVNTYTLGNQGYPSICAGSSGNFVVAWESRDQDGDGSAVLARRYAADGAPLGEDFQVNTFTAGNQQFPSVGCDASGSFVVVWEGREQDGDSYGIFGQRFTSDGLRLGTEFQVNTQTIERQLSAAVCRAPSGQFVVVWNSYDQDGDGYGIFGQRYDAAGARNGSEFQVNNFTDYAQQYPAIACDDSADFVVVWVSDYQDGDSYGVFGQRFASSGAFKGTEFQVHTNTAYSQESPAVASDAVGNFVVVWESYEYQDGDSYGVFGQRFSSTGDPAGTEFQVNTYTEYAQQSPAVSSDPCGNFTVVWSGGDDGDSYGIFAQSFSYAGAPVGTEFQVNTYTTGDQGTFSALGHVVAVANDARGDVTVVWQSADTTHPQDGDGFGIFGQRYAQCVGDCNGDGHVSVNELVVAVQIALGEFPICSCKAIDVNGDDVVTVNELVAAVEASIVGCS